MILSKKVTRTRRSGRNGLRALTLDPIWCTNVLLSAWQASPAHPHGRGFFDSSIDYSQGGINWENVNKRILPQLIYKGHVLRRETLCRSGLFFVCPTPVYSRITDRLGGSLTPYPAPAPGTLTFRWYDVGPEMPEGKRRPLVSQGQFTTTVEQVAYAFLSPGNMPPEGSYANAIRAKLQLLGA